MIALDGAYSVHILSADNAPRFHAWSKPQRRLTWYLLVCSLAGTEQISLDGRQIEVPSGGSYLIPPGALVDLASAQGNRPIWVHFEVQYNQWRGQHPHAVSYAADWNERRSKAQPSPRDVWGVDLPVLVPEPLDELFARRLPHLVDQWKRHTPLSVMESQHSLAGLLLALVSTAWRSQAVAPVDTAAQLARAEAVARESLGADFGVTEFAAAAGYSRSRFSVLYRRHTGRSPGHFLRSLRMQQATVLLQNSSLQIAEVGRLVGYSDPTVFGRVFRQAHGCSPSQWQMRMTQGAKPPLQSDESTERLSLRGSAGGRW